MNFTFESGLKAITISVFYLYYSRKIRKVWIVICICIDQIIKTQNKKFHKNPSSGSSCDTCEQTDGDYGGSSRFSRLFCQGRKMNEIFRTYLTLKIFRHFPPKSRYLRESHYRTSLAQHSLQRVTFQTFSVYFFLAVIPLNFTNMLYCQTGPNLQNYVHAIYIQCWVCCGFRHRNSKTSFYFSIIVFRICHLVCKNTVAELRLWCLPCNVMSLAETYQHFGRTYCLLLEGRCEPGNVDRGLVSQQICKFLSPYVTTSHRENHSLPVKRFFFFILLYFLHIALVSFVAILTVTDL